MVWYGKAVKVCCVRVWRVAVRHGGRVELWSGKVGCGEAVELS